MKITGVETIHIAEYFNLIWVRIHTDEGLIGYGESFRNASSVASYVHETLAPYLIGRDPLRVSEHTAAFRAKLDNRLTGFPTRSVELRAVSAIDMALWDLMGKALGQPIHQLLGGLCRDKAIVYNTCVRPGRNNVRRQLTHYVPPEQETRQTSDDWTAAGDDFTDLGTLAGELIGEGFTAMKFSPFDRFADKTGGLDISLADLKQGIAGVKRIREAVGSGIDVYVDYHGRWQLPGAIKVARILDEFDVSWHEDPIQMHNFDDVARFRDAVRGHVVGSEAFGTVDWFREALVRGAVDVMMFDVGWVGGISEGRDIAALARTFGRPFAPHDATGPLILASSVHLVMASPAALKQEIVRVFLNGYYRDLVTELPRVEGGFVYPMTGSGLGTELLPSLLARKDAVFRYSSSDGEGTRPD